MAEPTAPTASGPSTKVRVKRRVPPARRRPRRRTVVITLMGMALLGVALLTLDVVVRYVPALRALRDGQTALTQADSVVRQGNGVINAGQLTQVQTLLARAADDFGGRSAVLQNSLLLNVSGHLPWLGDQVHALLGLRDAGAAGAHFGQDLAPLISQALRLSGQPALQRFTAVASANGARLAAVVGDLDALDRAMTGIPTGGDLLGPLAAGRTAVRQLVPRLDAAARPAIALLGALPLAAGGTHRYLIVLDNPGEERPGGGFIGAVGDVLIQNGAIVDSQFRSSDFANPLVTSIAAPPGLAQTLFPHGTPWELSDANWSPDFPTSAATVARFYQLATGRTVDGVIGVDPVVLGYVLSVTGPVSAPPYPQVVGPGDTLLRLNQIINNPGQPGKAFLAPFGAAVLDRLLHAPLNQYGGMASALLRGAHEKHVVLSFTDAALMQLVDGAGMSGRLPAPLTDAVQVVDANVGGNKADLFVTRDYALAAAVGNDGQVRDTLRLHYRNPVQTEPGLQQLVTQYGGQYRDYLRVYVPETASLQAMTVSMAGGPAVPVSPASVDFELFRESIAYLLVVPPGGDATVTLTYTGPFADATSGPVQYAIAWAKEIGAAPAPVSIDIGFVDNRAHFFTTIDGDVRWAASAR